MSISYPYAEGDLIAAPQRYEYASFGGSAFLAAWRASRDAVVWNPMGEAPAPRAADLPSYGSPIETDDLLEALLSRLADGTTDDRDERWIAALVRKFETTKRVHRRYDGTFRAQPASDCRELARYLRVAETFAAYHEVRGSLPPLNALIKILDTLCALSSSLSLAERQRLTRLVAVERRAVAAIATRHGVDI